MTDIKPPSWADLRRLADELKAKIHTAGESARERWAKLQPSLQEAEAEVKKGASVAVNKLVMIGGALKDIGKDVADKLDKITHEPATKTVAPGKTEPPTEG